MQFWLFMFGQISDVARTSGPRLLPLGETLVASDMASLARLAALSRLGVAFSRWAPCISTHGWSFDPDTDANGDETETSCYRAALRRGDAPGEACW